MGSLKAADTLRKLAARVEVKAGRVPDHVKLAALHARVLAADLPEVRSLFEQVNAMLNFDPELSPATPEQYGVIRRLERRTFGFASTSLSARLTFAQASTYIRELNAAPRLGAAQ